MLGTSQLRRLRIAHSGRIRASLAAGCGLIGLLGLWWLHSDRADSQAAATLRTISNEFLTATMDATFTAASGMTAATGTGDYGFATVGGDPLNAGDNSQQIVLNQTNGIFNTSSFATLRILDDFQGQPLTASFRDMQIRGGGTAADGPAPAGGGTGGTAVASTEVFSLVQTPAAVGADGLSATFRTLPTTGTGGTGGTGTVTGRGWLVVRTITLVRNQVEIRYAITNRDSASRRAGLRMLFDTHPGATSGTTTTDNGAPFFVPNLGLITTEREFTTATTGIPEQLFTANDIGNPRVLAQAILSGSAAVTPDRALIVNRALLGTALFDYTPNSNDDILNDSGYALYWNPTVFGPGVTKTFITYLGLGFASGEYQSPFVVSTRSPTTLSVLPGPDPVNPGANQLFHFQPGQFTIAASVFNTSSLSFSNVSMNISLPTGLQLAGGETATKTIGIARPLQDVPVSWQVQAAATNAGALTYSVTANVPLIGSKTVARTIGIPALPQDIPLGSEVQMVTFPYTFTNAAPDQVFVSQLTGRLLPVSEIRLATYDPVNSEYLRFPSDINALQPGIGYWMRSLISQSLRLGDATNNPPRVVPTTGPFPIQLRSGRDGWNMVGNPFLLPIALGQLEVLQGGLRMSFQEAGDRQLIRPMLFTYQRGRGNVTADYFGINQSGDQFAPRSGYWIRALQDCQLVVSAPQFITQLSSRVVRPSVARAVDSPANWKLRLVASGAGSSDFATLGARPTANDLFDTQDVEKPPAFGEPIDVHFARANWGRNSGRFAVDIRQTFSGRKSWEVDVGTNLTADSDVTMTWPEVDAQSRSLRYLLTDLEAGKTVSMRLEPSYTFRAQAGRRVKRLRVTVELGGGTGSLRLLVQGASVSGGQITLPFTASESGVVSCSVLSPAGKVISVVCNEAPMTAGLNTLRWNGKNQQGLGLPRGVYVMRLVARSENGQAQAVKSVVVK